MTFAASIEQEYRAAIVAEARTWISTPYRHAAAIKGLGTDCAMLLVCVMQKAVPHIVPADFDGAPLKIRAGLKTPNEACIHGEIYKRKPHVGAVVHAHPPSIVLTSMAGIALRPIYGGYDPQGMRLALANIPVYQSSLTLHTIEQVHAMLEVMGENDCCILRGHGVVVAGRTVEQATIRAIKLDHLAKMNLQAAALGNVPSISQKDIDAFLARRGAPDRSTDSVWRFYVEWEKRIRG